jgi:hypothetical protein
MKREARIQLIANEVSIIVEDELTGTVYSGRITVHEENR